MFRELIRVLIAAICLAWASDPNAALAFDPRRDASQERGFYVPADLGDAVRELRRSLDAAEFEELER